MGDAVEVSASQPGFSSIPLSLPRSWGSSIGRLLHQVCRGGDGVVPELPS